MFCKFCGKELDPQHLTCPNCGNKTAGMHGGNGFWDMANKNPDKPVEERTVETTVSTHITPASSLNKAALLFICISILCIMCTIIIGLLSNQRIKILKNEIVDLQDELHNSLLENDNRISQIEEMIEDDAEELPDNQTALNIVASPTDESKELGFKSREGYYLFRFQLDGAVASFKWEKQSDNGDWDPLIFNGSNNVDERYGLMLVEDTEQGISKLIAVGLTSDSEGTYKCTALDNFGNERSDKVRLVITNVINNDGLPYISNQSPSITDWIPEINIQDAAETDNEIINYELINGNDDEEFNGNE